MRGCCVEGVLSFMFGLFKLWLGHWHGVWLIGEERCVLPARLGAVVRRACVLLLQLLPSSTAT